MPRPDAEPPGRRLWRAARLATLIAGVALFLLLSRSEIRKALLQQRAVLLAALVVVWLLAFLIARSR